MKRTDQGLSDETAYRPCKPDETRQLLGQAEREQKRRPVSKDRAVRYLPHGTTVCPTQALPSRRLELRPLKYSS